MELAVKLPKNRVRSVQFFYDVTCPFAYLASTQIEGICQPAGVEVEWKPVLLAGLYKGTSAPQGTQSATTVLSPPKRAYETRDLQWQTQRLGVVLSFPPGWPYKALTLNAMRLLTAVKENGLRRLLTHALYQANFVNHRNLNDRKVLFEIYSECWDEFAAKESDPGSKIGSSESLWETIQDPLIKAELTNETAKAVERDIFGVPFMCAVHEKPRPHGEDPKRFMFWGVSRLNQVKQIVNSPFGLVMRPPVMELVPKDSERLGSTEMRKRNTIELFFDFASPYAFLAWQRRKELDAYGTLTLKPVLLGGILQGIGTPGVPSMRDCPAKRRYNSTDLNRHFEACSVRGLFSSSFPLKTVTALRVALVDPLTVDCLFKAGWQQNQNLGDPRVLVEVLDRAGFDGQTLVQATKDPAIKRELIANTKSAIQSGMFGVPNYVVNGNLNHFVFGQDKLDLVQELCRGWVPKEGLHSKL